MTNAIATQGPLTIGIDLGDRRSHLVAVNRLTGERKHRVLPTTPAAFSAYFSKCPPGSLVALEASTHARWVKELLEGAGQRVLAANPRRLRLIAESKTKTDERDAETLCLIANADPSLLNPVELRSEEAQQDLELLHARELLVRQRAQAIAHVRDVVKGAGARLKGCSTASFHRQAPEQIPEALRASLMPLVSIVATLTKQIAGYDKQIERVAQERYSTPTQALQQIKGVGPLTSLAFTLVIGDVRRFARLRNVPAYLGLTPASRSSGKSCPRLPVTRSGNELLRRLLTNAAHYVLGPFGPDCALRRWGQRLTDRGGAHSKQRAVVAVARKLAVLLASLLKSGQAYDPQRGVEQSPVGAESVAA